MVVRYAVCGLSNRGLASFVLPLLGTHAGEDTALGYGRNDENFSQYGRVIAIVDPDVRRVQDFLDRFVNPEYGAIEVIHPEDYAEFLSRDTPDAVIVASPDDSHESYIHPALAAGIRVITEKPMTSTAAAAQRVLDAEARSKGEVIVTHNFRYTARHRQIKELIKSGAIGTPVHVDMSYHVDTRHGASYFIRWNRYRERSGGLSIHKSTHHLDLVNWWLSDEPRTVYAQGGRSFFGATSPHVPKDEAGNVLQGEERRRKDPYHQAQLGSGTFPENGDTPRAGLYDLPYYEEYPAGKDLSVFDDDINIEDHLATLITYNGGATLNYSVNFSSPWEGYRLIITGTHGQIETLNGRLPDGTALPGSDAVVYRPLFAEPEEHPIEKASGGHEGADPLLRHDLFVGPTDYSREVGMVATSWEGALAVAMGEAMWRSAESGEPIQVSSLIRRPD